jgi:enolase
MSMMKLKIFGTALLLAAGSVACLPARADTGSTPAKAVTDQDVRNYAGATAALLSLNNTVAARIATATPTERATIEQQANADRQMILGRYALDPTRFNAISKAVEADPALGDRVRKVMMDSILGT